MIRLNELVDRVARSNIPVLVVGETGVGKELVAGAVHARSPRARRPFVRINCAALPEPLLESELFGFERGAFTGALQAKPGLIESADGGTFFLDEVGEMPLTTQAKLLRVLESGETTRLGALRPCFADLRFVAATNRHLPAAVAEGRFRRDLYYRLNGITITIPPLRERISEIEGLALGFLASAASRSHGSRVRSLSPGALALLERHAWPGNIRELKNVIERAVMLCDGSVVEDQHVQLDPDPSGDGERCGRLLRMEPIAERRLIERALAESEGHQGRAAQILGISRRTLINRLDAFGMKQRRKT
jgi:transcriptional regulator with PAS, ATPase and Fis domain